MNDSKRIWEIIFILPNLGLRDSFGNSKIAIVPHNDSRIVDIVSSNKFARILVNGFEDQFRRKVHPAMLIIPSDSPTYMRDIETIVSFRNIFAISSIIHAYEHRLRTNFVGYTLYSDFFDFYPVTITRQNNGYITSSPSILGIADEAIKFRGQKSPSLADPCQISVQPDKLLFPLLENAWKRRFVDRKLTEWQTTALFRSLEMAYQATTMPFKNHSTIYDFGSSAGLWVSAFEILSHSKKDKASLITVLDLLERYQWNDKKVRRRSYKIQYQQKNLGANILQKLYKELYDTRNDFLHGNPVKVARLYPFKNKKLNPITWFAPLIYKVGLMSFLEKLNPKLKGNDEQKKYISKFLNERGLSGAILKSKGK
jgi:hypothetical protein